jgi:tRNA (cytidine56-2'-O)-methyltransferase
MTADISQSSRVTILRIGHRIQRDVRVTTHVCLTARALGADRVIISDVVDRRIPETIDRVSSRFGGSFVVETGKPWRRVVADWEKAEGKIVHLTAYGIPVPDVIERIRASNADKLVVVGAEKVPGELFHLADWNVAVTSQPISEVSALGIFLDWLFEHRRLQGEFVNARLRIVPTEHGKRVEHS